MTVKELKEKARQTEVEIMLTLNKFMRETGIKVGGVSLQIHDHKPRDGGIEPVCIGATIDMHAD